MTWPRKIPKRNSEYGKTDAVSDYPFNLLGEIKLTDNTPDRISAYDLFTAGRTLDRMKLSEKCALTLGSAVLIGMITWKAVDDVIEIWRG